MKNSDKYKPLYDQLFLALVTLAAGGIIVIASKNSPPRQEAAEALSAAFVQKVEPKANLSSTCVLEPSKVVQTYICTVLGGRQARTVVCQLGGANSATNGCWLHNNHELDGE